MSAHLTRLLVEREPRAQGTIAGIVLGTVTNNHDDAGLNRVKVKLPWLSDGDESPWARVASPMAGNGRGLFFLPEVGDEVLVMFERGDARFPYVIGSLWNGKDKAPGSNDDGKNNERVIRSRSGHVIRFHDEPGKETLEIIDASGKNSITIDTANHTIAINSTQDIELRAPKGKITISAKTVDIHATGNGTVTADGKMIVQATGDLAVTGKTVNIN
jgi:uncharacterized protein involved in type VI secretion and phage assembly